MKTLIGLILLLAVVLGAVVLLDGAPDKGAALAQCEIAAIDKAKAGEDGVYVALCMRAAGYERRDDNAGCKLAMPANPTPEETVRSLIRGDVPECYSPVKITGRIGEWWKGLASFQTTGSVGT